MSVWLCIPSARPPEEAEKCLVKWRAMGYKIALWVDDKRKYDAWNNYHYPNLCFYDSEGGYPGYAQAVNNLARLVLSIEKDPCGWIVIGGDDTLPDPNKQAEEIAAELTAHFGGTFGVCQPTGDRFAYSKASMPGWPNGSAPIDRVAGSPWLGREWCLRINQGKGPLWPEYTHMFSDEELQNVAIKYGVFWQRLDLIHLHHHFMRKSDAIDSPAVSRPIPKHLVEANSAAHWEKYKGLFEQRKRKGFPGSEPL